MFNAQTNPAALIVMLMVLLYGCSGSGRSDSEAARKQTLLDSTIAREQLIADSLSWNDTLIVNLTERLDSLEKTVEKTTIGEEPAVVARGDKPSATSLRARLDTGLRLCIVVPNPGGEPTYLIGSEADSIARLLDKDPGRAPGGEAIATLWRYRQGVIDLRLANLRRERLTRQLDVARNQRARLEQ